MSAQELTQALRGVEALLGDGARLDVREYDEAASRLELVMDLSGVECFDCVLPPDVIAETITGVLQEQFGASLAVVIDDPRVGPAAAVPTTAKAA